MHSRALPAPARTHVAPQSSKAPGVTKVMPFSSRWRVPLKSGQDPMRTRGAPAHVKGRAASRADARGAGAAAPWRQCMLDAPSVSPDHEQHSIAASVQHARLE